jgi:hypothetical protein
MCCVCTDWAKGSLTSKEALRNLGEMIESTDKGGQEEGHYFSVVEKILDKEMEASDNDPETMVEQLFGD